MPATQRSTFHACTSRRLAARHAANHRRWSRWWAMCSPRAAAMCPSTRLAFARTVLGGLCAQSHKSPGRMPSDTGPRSCSRATSRIPLHLQLTPPPASPASLIRAQFVPMRIEASQLRCTVCNLNQHETAAPFRRKVIDSHHVHLASGPRPRQAVWSCAARRHQQLEGRERYAARPDTGQSQLERTCCRRRLSSPMKYA